MQADSLAGSVAYGVLPACSLVNAFSESFLKELSQLFKDEGLPSLGEIQILCRFVLVGLRGASTVPSRYVSDTGLAFCRGCASLDADLAQYGVFQRVSGDEEE